MAALPFIPLAMIPPPLAPYGRNTYVRLRDSIEVQAFDTKNLVSFAAPGGQPYYHNAIASESTYIRPLPTFLWFPLDKKEKPIETTPIPGTDWLRVKTNKGNTFCANKGQKECVWTVPEDINELVVNLEKEEAAAEAKNSRMSTAHGKAHKFRRARVEDADENEVWEDETNVAEEEAKKEEKELTKKTVAKGTPEINMPARVDLSVEEAKALFKVASQKAESADPKDEFERLPREEVKSTRTVWSDWWKTWKKDRRFYGRGRDHRESEKKFWEWTKELEKRTAAQKAEADFISVLKETGGNSPNSVNRKLGQDPCYTSVGPSSLREEIFDTCMKTLSAVSSSLDRTATTASSSRIEATPHSAGGGLYTAERTRKDRAAMAVKGRKENNIGDRRDTRSSGSAGRYSLADADDPRSTGEMGGSLALVRADPSTCKPGSRHLRRRRQERRGLLQPMDLRRGAQAAVDRVVDFHSKHTKTITTSEEIAQVATISANGDTHVGNLIATAMEKVGKEGVITVKEGRTIEDDQDHGGDEVRPGYISPYFITDLKSQKVDSEKPFILLSEKKIALLQDTLPSLEAAAQARRPLLIIAEDVDGEVLAACVLNKLGGQLQVAAVKVPGFEDNRKSVLGDLAILTGGTAFTDELKIKLERATSDLLGSTGSVTITKEDTIFLNGEGTYDAIQARCEQISTVLNDVGTNVYDKTKLQERLAKLRSSEVEVGEKKDGYDDALNATRAAVEEGILPRGDVALLKASLALPSSTPGTSGTSSDSSSTAAPILTSNVDQELGISIVPRALSQPAGTILTNAGKESSVIVGTLLSHPPYSNPENFAMGIDAQKGCYVDMIKSGIVDPLKVVKTALMDAAGVASLLTTSEACIVDAKEKEKPSMGGMGGGFLQERDCEVSFLSPKKEIFRIRKQCLPAKQSVAIKINKFTLPLFKFYGKAY
ncbi:hypothetical protein BD410DRAFT_808577 [Rickenella mellea]|uniref:WW domain-containing protein n=1 Tax=Rickenella mellea TaxID=50990 RepID=A0A4Y7PN21_9AGAM|nr:hypothetical protein BD410DRAFT_808577 [Rickenella mellea]